MLAYSFAFGPDNSFCLTTPVGCTFSGLSNDLLNILRNDTQAKNRFVSIGPYGKYFYSRINSQGDSWNGHVEDHVKPWFEQRYAAGDGQFQVSYGPSGSWFACTSQGGYWSGGDIADSIAQATKDDFWPVMGTLGVEGSYVLVGKNGGWKWDLKGKYDKLETILKENVQRIKAVALDPFEEGRYFIRFEDGSWACLVHPPHLDEVRKTLEEADEYECQVMIEAVAMKRQTDALLLEQNRRNNAMIVEQMNTMVEISRRNLAGHALGL